MGSEYFLIYQSILTRPTSQCTPQPPPEHRFDLAPKWLRPDHACLLGGLPDVLPLVSPHGGVHPRLVGLLPRFGMGPQPCIPGVFIEQGVGDTSCSTSLTTPAVLPWMLYHPCAHGIQSDIPATHHQILVPTDDRTLVPSFPQGP